MTDPEKISALRDFLDRYIDMTEQAYEITGLDPNTRTSRKNEWIILYRQAKALLKEIDG